MTVRKSSIAESDGGVRLSAWIAPSASSKPRSSRSARRDSAESQEHDGRASVVGHRGFLAARTTSLRSNKKSSAPPNIQLAAMRPGLAGSLLSPVISIAGSEGELLPPAFSPKTLHFRNFDGVQRLSSDYLSDPESNSTLSSRNRTSSSCSSYESAMRKASTTVVRETGRWSIASQTSMPELMHSRRRSKLALQKSSISRPLESLPQSPGAETDPQDGTMVPRVSQMQLVPTPFGMRRPQSPGERASMQNAGQAVQRGRPPTPNRFSRLLAEDESRQMKTAVATGWI